MKKLNVLKKETGHFKKRLRSLLPTLLWIREKTRKSVKCKAESGSLYKNGVINRKNCRVLSSRRCKYIHLPIIGVIVLSWTTEYTQSGNGWFLANIPIMMEKSALAGESGGFTPIPFHSSWAITYKFAVKVRSTVSERADTLLLFHLYPYMCSVSWTPAGSACSARVNGTNWFVWSKEIISHRRQSNNLGQAHKM